MQPGDATVYHQEAFRSFPGALRTLALLRNVPHSKVLDPEWDASSWQHPRQCIPGTLDLFDLAKAECDSICSSSHMLGGPED